jgi:hypothetical protein
MARYGGERLNKPIKFKECVMDQEKIKEIEAKLHQLLTQEDQNRDKKAPTKSSISGVRVIRRRKGKPDFHIS